MTLQRHIEDRCRRNKLRLRKLPEATGPKDLAETAAAIFRKISDEILPANLEFDRIHRALGTHSTDPNQPRDVICWLHHYTHKEAIICKAWEAGNIDFDGVTVKILPDLSRAALQRSALLHPVLDLARQFGVTYR